MRGASPRGDADQRDLHGLIPACAGHPRRTDRDAAALRAHPCVRGASEFKKREQKHLEGSSLRARGILYLTGPNTSASACSRSM